MDPTQPIHRPGNVASRYWRLIVEKCDGVRHVGIATADANAAVRLSATPAGLQIESCDMSRQPVAMEINVANQSTNKLSVPDNDDAVMLMSMSLCGSWIFECAHTHIVHIADVIASSEKMTSAAKLGTYLQLSKPMCPVQRVLVITVSQRLRTSQIMRMQLVRE